MVSIQIQLAVLWVCTMLVYLLGDVIRLFAGDFKPGEIEGKKMTGVMTFGIAVLMLIPILMVLASVSLPDAISKWANIGVAIFFLLFNLLGLKGYKPYDQFLLVVSMVFNLLVVYFAWNAL